MHTMLQTTSSYHLKHTSGAQHKLESLRQYLA
jgi:hypothetical protein